MQVSPSAAGQAERQSTSGAPGSDSVLNLTGLAFITLLVTYALFGDRVAGIAFWAVMFGVPALLRAVSALGGAWGGRQEDERLKVALLALSLSEQRRADSERAGDDYGPSDGSVK